MRQGRVLSPYLFNLFLEFIMTDVLESFRGDVTTRRKKVSNDDDIDLIAAIKDELRDSTRRMDDATTKYGMEISAEKGKVMVTPKEDIKLHQPSSRASRSPQVS